MEACDVHSTCGGNSRMFHSIFAMVQKEQYQKWEATLGKTRKREPEKNSLFFLPKGACIYSWRKTLLRGTISTDTQRT